MDSKEIIEKAGKLFMQFGIRSQTMDDIARELGISKKTLYQYVTDKEDLVQKTFFLHFENEKCCIKTIHDNYVNAIEEMFEISKHVSEHLKVIHPSINYDVKKYHPNAWKIFLEYRNKFIYKTISENMEKGIKEELYRQNLNIPVLTRLY